MRFSKFSVVSVFANWLHSSERNPRSNLNFWITENFWVLFLKLSNILPKWHTGHLKNLNFIWTQKNLLFPNYCSEWRSVFPTKEFCVQMELFGNFSSKWPVSTHEHSTPFINLPLKWGFLIFLLFQSFLIGSIAQNKNQTHQKFLNFWKPWNLFLKLSNTYLNMTYI